MKCKELQETHASDFLQHITTKDWKSWGAIHKIVQCQAQKS